MTPADMISKHDPDNGSVGDCFRCCVASILDLPAIDVPHFMAKDWFKTEGFTWYADLYRWLALRGLSYLELQIDNGFHGPRWFEHLSPIGFNAYHVMSGVGPRGDRHSVVARNGVMVHDPHPSRGGLTSPGTEGWQYGFFLYRGH